MQPSEYLGRRLLHAEAQAYVEHTQKLISTERDFTIEMMKLLLQAIITGKLRG